LFPHRPPAHVACHSFPTRRSSDLDCDTVFSYPMFRDLEKAQTTFTGMAAHRLFGANLAFGGQTLNGDGLLVSGSYFPVLGLQPRSEEHTSDSSHEWISYAVFCLKK